MSNRMTTIRQRARQVYTPYYNEWNKDVYQRRLPFDEDPLEIMASSTSGACVAITESHFIGLTAPLSSRFAWDGRELVVKAPEEALFQMEGAGDKVWEAYHRALALPPAPAAPFGRVPEYCTWVEQGWEAARKGSTPVQEICMEFVRTYLGNVSRSGWPRGRFTVDEGWCPRHGPGGFGDWTPKPGLDMVALAGEIAAAGHVPGLWFAPVLVSPESETGKNCPELLGEPFSMTAESGWNGFLFLRPGPAARDFLAGLFRRAWDWGFRKFKLDIFYGPKRLMIELHQLCWEAAQTLPGDVELEGHVPDPFAARWVHVVRLNDVLIAPEYPEWRKVAEAHWRVCCQSLPEHLFNLDHLGGNRTTVTEIQWLEHAAQMRGQLARGYPVISLLPEHISPAALDAATQLLVAKGGGKAKMA